MDNELKPRRQKFYYSLFRRYVSFINSRFYFRRVHTVGIENMPKDGNPVVLVSNHQNCLNDPLALALMFKDRRPHFLARANVFKNPMANRALRYLGLLPAYRVKFDGFSAVKKNQDTLEEVDVALQRGETVILYPECGHQDKRWLGNFSQAYLKMAFGAAEATEFKKEVFIMPTANHYSNYYHAREDMMIKFGTPISIAPYYELYKERPRQAMREVNELVRGQIESLMLDIRDLDNYDTIDFLRESSFGEHYAQSKGYHPDNLPEKLLADKELVAKIERAKAEKPEEVRKIFNNTRRFISGLKELGIREWLFEGSNSIFDQIWQGILLIMGLPLFLVCIVPTALLFIVPSLFIKRFIKDQMFRSSINVGATVLITYPLCCIIPSVVLWCTAGWLWGLIYFVAFPVMFVYAWNYIRWTIKYIGCYRFLNPRNKKKVARLSRLRNGIYRKLDKLLQQTADYNQMANTTREAEQQAAAGVETDTSGANA